MKKNKKKQIQDIKEEFEDLDDEIYGLAIDKALKKWHQDKITKSKGNKKVKNTED